jgi:SAM-dependent methyltransferase
VTAEGIYAAYLTMSVLERRWVPQVDGKGREGSYPYIPLPLAQFLAGMETARAHFAEIDKHRAHPRRFLDAGCGIGTKLSLASNLGWDVTGLEFVPEYIEAAWELCSNAALLNVDVREFKEWRKFDLIYTYRPGRRRRDDGPHRLRDRGHPDPRQALGDSDLRAALAGAAEALHAAGARRLARGWLRASSSTSRGPG